MSAQRTIVQLLVWFSVKYGVESSYLGSSSNLARTGKTSPMPAALNAVVTTTAAGLFSSSTTTMSPLANAVESFADSFWPAEVESEDQVEGRGRKKKYKKYEMLLLTKMLMGLKIALLGVVLPLGIIAAKILSWKAVTLSLLAYMLAKIVFVKNLFMSKPQNQPPPSTPAPSPPAPIAPIIIHSSGPSHDSTWKRQHHPKIHLQPEVHVHQAGEDHHTPSWTWAEESRDSKDAHDLAFGSWFPKIAKIV